MAAQHTVEDVLEEATGGADCAAIAIAIAIIIAIAIAIFITTTLTKCHPPGGHQKDAFSGAITGEAELEHELIERLVLAQHVLLQEASALEDHHQAGQLQRAVVAGKEGLGIRRGMMTTRHDRAELS